MKSLVFIAALLIAVVSPTAHANGPWVRTFQDYKFPSQAATEHMTWAVPSVASVGYFKSGQVLSSTAATTITSFLQSATPDFARNVTLTPTGTTNAVASGTAVVTGTNIFGKTITENFAITNAQSTATTGSKAFATVASVVFPAASLTGATLSIGTGSKLGITRCVKNAGDYDFSEFGGVYDATRGTLAVNATAVESNTFTPNSAMDGAHDVDLFYIQNYRCYGGQ